MKRFSSLLAFVVLSGASLLQAVTFGEPDAGRHPYVGTILFRTASGYASCTGTLLSPTVMLTAGHCVKEGGQLNEATWVNFSPVIDFASRSQYGTLVDYLNSGADGWLKTSSVAAHPQYDDYAQFPSTYDIGVVVLASPVTLSTYGTLPPLSFLQTIATHRGATENRFTVVGYGLQGVLKPFASDLWERYVGNSRLLELNSKSNAGMSAKFSNNPGTKTSGGSCNGDSGGPVFYSTTNMVTAVVSWGKTPCIGVDYQFRTDTKLAQDFLLPYLAK